MESSYYAQLPTSLLLSKDLSCFQKLLYADIQSLTFQRGYCWASNEYLSERHNKSEKHISKQISKLIDTGQLFAIDRAVGRGSKGTRKLFTRSTYLEYAKEKGIEINGVKNDTINDLNGVKNDNHSNISKRQVIKELTKVNSPRSGLGTEGALTNSSGNKQNRQSLKIKKNRKSNNRYLNKLTIELIDYWNTFDTLTTHLLKRKRNVSPLHKQTKIIQDIECSLYKILNGTFYSKIDNIQKGLKIKKYTIEEIKKSIQRISIANGSNYSARSQRISFTQFLFNPHSKFGTGKNKYRYRCAFLHFINNTPQKAYDTPTRKKSEYPILVDRTIKKLTGTINLTDRQYNQVVNQIEKAMVFMKKISNGNLAENRMNLPMLLHDTMIDNRLELTVEQLPLGVYNLEGLMRKRLMIK